MTPRSSLVAAVACGLAAVALVAADLAFNVEARIEARGADGSWTLIAQSDAASTPRPWGVSGCGNDLRLTVHNGLPWATTVTVRTTMAGPFPAMPAVESWHLGAGEHRSREFRLNGTAPAATPDKGFHSLEVQVGDDIHLHASVCPEGVA